MNDEQTPPVAEDQPPAPVVDAPEPAVASAEPADEPETPIRQSGEVVSETLPPAPVEFSWQASEYVQHHKSPLWYMAVVALVVVLSGFSILLKSWLSIGVFIVGGIAVIVYAKRPPRTLQYELSADGMRVEGKLYNYQSFRSFSVLRDVAWHTIDLEPTQRFMPRMSVLFNDEDLDPIVEHLLQHLPRVDRAPDAIERATRFLRF